MTSSGPHDRVVRVFISSTFRDMQADREELVKQAFPRLRQRCERRGVVWGEFDLRWGITDEQKAEGQVLPICLTQIGRCRPFFIGLLGERYGWIPEQIDPALLEREPWLQQYRGRSVTELEMLHGVLANPDVAEHAVFYLRSPRYIERLPEAERPTFLEAADEEEVRRLGHDEAERRVAERRARLQALKQAIRDSGRPVRDYDDPRELGRLVVADLERVIDGLYPEGSAPAPLDREEAAHAAFAASRARVYVGRPRDVAVLDGHVAADGPPLTVLGASGTGKSALLANWLAARIRTPDELVLAHYIGASPESTDSQHLLARLIGEIGRRLAIDVPVPDETDKRRVAFANALHMAATRGRVLLVIDGLNQLEDRDQAPDLPWLPERFPPGVRVVLSTLPGRALQEVERRGWPTWTVEPLEAGERSLLIQRYLEQYGRQLSSSQTQRIALADGASNPLYLRVLLDELRVHGEHETLDRRIDDCLAARTPVDLYMQVLARYTRDYERDRPGLVGDAFTALLAARWGLAETELLDLLGDDAGALPQAVWSPLYLAAEASLLSRSGVLSFAHDFLRQAVERTCAPSSETMRLAHLRLADYFSRRDPSPRRLDELPWQLAAAGEWQRLAAVLADAATLAAMWETARFDLKRYWTQIETETSERMASAYAAIVDHPDRHRAVVPTLAQLFLDTGHLPEAERLREAEIAHAREDGTPRALASALGGLALIRWAQGRMEDADALRTGQEETARAAGDGEGTRDALAGRALILAARAENAAALSLQEQLADLCRAAGDARGLLRALGNRAAILSESGRGQEALEVLDEFEKVARERGDREMLVSALGLRGAAFESVGEQGSAQDAYREEEAAARELGAWDAIASAIANRATILFERGREEEALALTAEAEAIARRIGWKHGMRDAVFNQGNHYRSQGETGLALDKYREAEALSLELGDGLTEVMALLGQAWALTGMERYAAAFEIYGRAERTCREHAAPRAATSLGGDVPASAASGYAAMLVNTLYEQAECLGKANRFDEGYAMVEEANRIAETHGLPSILSAARATADMITRPGGLMDMYRASSHGEAASAPSSPAAPRRKARAPARGRARAAAAAPAPPRAPVTADDFFEAGQWQEALRRIQRAIDTDLDPPTSQTLLRLGHCLLRAQESPDAPALDRVEQIVTRLRDGGDEEMAAELERELATRDTRPKRRRWRLW